MFPSMSTTVFTSSNVDLGGSYFPLRGYESGYQIMSESKIDIRKKRRTGLIFNVISAF